MTVGEIYFQIFYDSIIVALQYSRISLSSCVFHLPGKADRMVLAQRLNSSLPLKS